MRRGGALKRSRIRAISAKTAAKRAEAKPARDAYLEAHPWCEAAEAGAPGGCFGGLHVHETTPRARGGDIGDVSIFKSVCDLHNTAISQDRDTMRWAYATGFLFH